MAESNQRSIGPYRIGPEIGRGGMGVVYLAHDERLNRDVAIKALPEEFAADPARLDRLEREARALAQLNHPNVAGIHGLEEHDGRQYLVLEYVEGHTLAERIDAGPLSVDDALEFAVHIAAGVEAAHDAGIIHRDLKPANIKITPDGVAKVLDFGLARADNGTHGSSSPDIAESPTVVAGEQHSPTIPGAILGTAPYMSPEQARGRRVDRRTDIWSFGVIIYEMLTGISPFEGETATDSIGAIMHKDVDLQRLPPDTPPMVYHVLERCLDRDKARRYRDIGDVRIELSMVDDGPRGDIARPGRRQGIGRAVAGAIVLMMVSAAAAWLLKPTPVTRPEPASHVSVILPWDRDRIEKFAISADGRMLAFLVRDETGAASEWGVHIRHLDGPDFERVHTMRNHPVSLAFTPDGRDLILAEISELQRAFVYRLSLADRRTVMLVERETNQFNLGDGQGMWLNEDELLMHGRQADRRSLYGISRHDGSIRSIGAIPGDDAWARVRAVSADGQRALYTMVRMVDARFDMNLCLLDLTTGEAHDVVDRTIDGLFVADDMIAVYRDAAWTAMRLDPETDEIIGALLPLSAPTSDDVVMAARGHMAYFHEPNDRLAICRVDRDGTTTTLFPDRRWYTTHVVASPDGNWICVTFSDSPGADQMHLAAVDMASGRHRVIMSGAVVASQWLPDGRLLYLTNPTFESASGVTHADIMSWHPDRGEEMIASQFSSPTPFLTATPDGSIILTTLRFNDANRPAELAANDDDCIALFDTSAPDGAPSVYYSSGGRENAPTLSPDGRWLAFAEQSGGRRDIFLTPFDPDEPPRPMRVSTDGGWGPFWSSDGSELFYMARDGSGDTVLMSVTVTPGATPPLSTPSAIMSTELFGGGRPAPTPDGGFVYLRKPDPRPGDEHLHIVLHWRDDVRRRLEQQAPPRDSHH